MSTETAPQMVVEDGMDGEAMARIKSMQAEDPNLKNIEYGKAEYDEPIEDAEINLDAPAEPAENDEVKGKKGEDELKVGAGGGEYVPVDMTAFTNMAKDQGISEDELAEKIFHGRKFKVKMNGKPREMDYSAIKNHLSRETTFQKKYDEANKSEEMKMGTLVAAAKGGDKGAQKKLQGLLKEFTGAEDVDDMNDKLDSVEGVFDEEAGLIKKRNDEAFETEFEDVKEDVDYEANLATIHGDIKDRMPAKIWERYWNSPADRKSMYALAASGRADLLLDTFQSEVDSLPLEKQLELAGDPDMYGVAFLSMINRLNAQNTKPAEETTEVDNLAAVSSGTKPASRTRASETPDFDKMTSQEFKAWQVKNGLAN
tara:strand:+ start:8905 stop:10014 length:1110 start_codon:yes stop_codon:yes gene_type:complete